MSAAKGAGADAGMGAALAYLAELEAHNDRAWFAETKAERAGALAAFDVLVADVNQLAAEYERANAERQTQHMRLEDRIDPAAREKLWRMLRG